MNASGPESISSAIKQAEAASAQISQQINNPGLGIESQLHAPADIAGARSFFVSQVDLPTAPLSGIEHSGVAAMKAAEGAISPMLQLIMRLPGHLGLFSSFLEAFKNLFFSHDLLSNFNLGDIASSVDLTHVTGLTHVTHLGHNLGALPSHLHAFHIPTDIMSNVGTAHLHINPLASLKQSMNISAGIDLKNPQFEGSGASTGISSTTGQVSGSGDSLAGPSLSSQAITLKLAPSERIFNSTSLESPSNNYSNANNLLAFNSQTPGTGITNSTTTSNLSSISQVSNSNGPSMVNTNPAATNPVENLTSSHSSNVPELHAKALSLDSVMHKGSHMPSDRGLIASKHIANHQFSKLASSTHQAFQTAKHDVPATTNHTYSIKPVNNSLITHKTLANSYTVKPGDSLWKISKNIFGSGDKWTQLYKFNGSTIGGNPGLIFSGQKLALGGSTVNPLPHLAPTHSMDQLAQHISPSSTIAHTQSTLAHTQHPIMHNETTLAHSQQAAVHNDTAVVVHTQHPLVHNSNHTTVNHDQLKQNPTDNKLAQALPHKPIVHGLAVKAGHDQLLSGAGGAQAANTTQAVTNKLSGLSSGKGKSVVSFSLAPDLAQW